MLGAPGTNEEQEFGLGSIIQPTRTSGKTNDRTLAIGSIWLFLSDFCIAANTVLHTLERTLSGTRELV